jgi:alpha-galactosidase
MKADEATVRPLPPGRVVFLLVLALGLALDLVPRPVAAADNLRLRGQALAIDFDARLHSRVVALFDGREIVLGPFSPSETLVMADKELSDFAFERKEEERVADTLGPGQRYRLSGRSGDIEKTVEVTFYDEFPALAVFEVSYRNLAAAAASSLGWVNHRYALAAAVGQDEPAFWSFQPGSYEARPDWVLPLKKGFRQENYLGMNATDYGGGTPVVDVWRRDVGLAVGHVEITPKLVSLTVERRGKDSATLAVRFSNSRTIGPGETLRTLRTFVAVHRGDHFRTLAEYRALMARQGLRIPAAPASAFEPIWCAWGYGREFTPEQIVATLPIAKRLGFGWVTIDDGWQVAEGDWTPTPEKFPRGDADMKALVDQIHAAGFKAQLWWAPLAADPGSRLERSQPELLLKNIDGSRQKISWWDSEYLCPAYGPVHDSAQAFVRKALGEWGFDGLKIDGQHLNAAPTCFNPAHHHTAPEQSVEGVPGFFHSIWDAAIETRPEALVEICPCGTAYSFFTMPYLNMVVASDPESSWQVRLKGKTLKALVGDGVAYFGDHVELSDGGEDFASTFGIGGVVGTNFAWPGAPGKKDPELLLTPEREQKWGYWIHLYQQMRLSQGEYLGSLYDIGFDRPEAHAIRKGGSLYYAFYDKRFHGAVELRGLNAQRYRVRAYETGVDLGSVTGPMARLAVTFQDHLLLEAKPE